MFRLLHVLLLGLFGAAAVHIAILFLLPTYSERDVWSAMAEEGDPYAFIRLGEGNGNPLLAETQNPFFDTAACRFDLENGMVRITADERVPFWSFSVYDRDGFNVFNANDRSATNRGLDALIVNAAQLLELRKGVPETLATSLIAQTDIGEGMVVIRVFVPDGSWRIIVERFFEGLRCETL
ncbi:hypothetical protein A33O_09849 [Nitratireductor aquibiodomus RA22]|uniref:Uncharacterized membrane protein n=2 Tax=Nitratireductor aquibiodomus TaxID=204799 RepID=A0A1H4N9Y5_9HYPH|nr:hypothetical protein [Nitratireductor aquibiodomus]EIM74914.1 hypothetical protein A33O_09849 [Nitratireductor aquibiodomus RA22]SEB91362.1 Uncharacterized membrane protein [Nitratireductor aquibiodomus]